MAFELAELFVKFTARDEYTPVQERIHKGAQQMDSQFNRVAANAPQSLGKVRAAISQTAEASSAAVRAGSLLVEALSPDWGPVIMAMGMTISLAKTGFKMMAEGAEVAEVANDGLKSSYMGVAASNEVAAAQAIKASAASTVAAKVHEAAVTKITIIYSTIYVGAMRQAAAATAGLAMVGGASMRALALAAAESSAIVAAAVSPIVVSSMAYTTAALTSDALALSTANAARGCTMLAVSSTEAAGGAMVLAGATSKAAVSSAAAASAGAAGFTAMLGPIMIVLAGVAALIMVLKALKDALSAGDEAERKYLEGRATKVSQLLSTYSRMKEDMARLEGRTLDADKEALADWRRQQEDEQKKESTKRSEGAVSFWRAPIALVKWDATEMINDKAGLLAKDRDEQERIDAQYDMKRQVLEAQAAKRQSDRNRESWRRQSDAMWEVTNTGLEGSARLRAEEDGNHRRKMGNIQSEFMAGEQTAEDQRNLERETNAEYERHRRARAQIEIDVWRQKAQITRDGEERLKAIAADTTKVGVSSRVAEIMGIKETLRQATAAEDEKVRKADAATRAMAQMYRDRIVRALGEGAQKQLEELNRRFWEGEDKTTQDMEDTAGNVRATNVAKENLRYKRELQALQKEAEEQKKGVDDADKRRINDLLQRRIEAAKKVHQEELQNAIERDRQSKRDFAGGLVERYKARFQAQFQSITEVARQLAVAGAGTGGDPSVQELINFANQEKEDNAKKDAYFKQIVFALENAGIKVPR